MMKKRLIVNIMLVVTLILSSSNLHYSNRFATDVYAETMESIDVNEYEVTDKYNKFIIKYKNVLTDTDIEQEVLNIYSTASFDVDGNMESSSISLNNITTDKWQDDYIILSLSEKVKKDEVINVLNSNGNIDFIQPVYDYTTNGHVEEISGSFHGSEMLEDIVNTNYVEGEQTSKALVALIDTGVDINSFDLTDNLWESEQGSHGWNAIDDNNVICDSSWGNDMLHGTHLYGVISGKSNIDAHENTNTEIMVIRAFQNGKSNTMDLVESIEYAIENGADIINCSWGSGDNDTVLRDIIENNPEVIFVCSAGNGGYNIDNSPIYPAAYDLPNVITVTSVNEDKGISYFANYGTRNVDIAAYGRNIESTFPNNKYGTLSGTSVAASYVTRVISEMICRNSVADSETIVNRLYDTSEKISSLVEYVKNARLVNYSNAMNGAEISELSYVNYIPEFLLNNKLSDSESWELFQTYDNKEIETDGYISLLLKSDNSVWTVGYNNYGQLGDGTFDDSDIPKKIDLLEGTTELSASTKHCLALKADGTVWAWGDNADGQLGIIGGDMSNIPMQVVGLSSIVSISAGYDHSVAIDSAGNVWTWGSNEYGQLGRDGNNKIPEKVAYLHNIQKISAGNMFTVALDSENTVWTWGGNSYGQLGDGSTASRSEPGTINGSYTDVDAGYNHCLAIDINGNLMSWGYNNYGQLGLGNSVQMTVPTFSNMSAVEKISAGYNYSLIINQENDVFACGNNNYGQLGINSTDDKNIFTKLEMLNNVESVSAGYCHSGAINTDGQIFTWGYNNYGQLCDNPILESYIPIKTKLANITDISAGYGHGIAIDGEKTWSWGLNNKGQLGLGNTNNVSEPTLVDIPVPIKMADCGYYHTVAVDIQGKVWSWGYNNRGQLGNDTTVDSTIPSVLANLSDVKTVSAGYYHTLALKSDGTVWSWGYNNYGQLGDGTKLQKTTPVQVSGLSDVVEISAGNNFSIAIKSDGTVWAWGYNNRGQLGLGTMISVSVPTQIDSLMDVISISAGQYHSTAISSSGQLWSWGYNNYGQLGNGNNSQSSVPVLLNSNYNIRNISNKYNSNLAVDSAGNVISWGYNPKYQLGISNTDNSNVPVYTGTKDIYKVMSGYNHSIALDNSGNVFTWGYNNYGQLGDGTKRQRVAPYCIIGFVADESNISIDSAAEIYTDVIHYLSFANSGDALWYKIAPQYNDIYTINISDGFDIEIYKAEFGVLQTLGSEIQNYFSYPNQYYIKITRSNVARDSFSLEISGGNGKIAGKAFETVLLSDEYYSNITDYGMLYKNGIKLGNTKELSGVSWLCNYNNKLYFNAGGNLNRLSDLSYDIVGANIDARYIVADENYIYFSNWSDGGKLYRGSLSSDGELNCEKMCDDSVIWITSNSDYLYYKNASDKFRTYRILKTAINFDSGELIE